jgi:hypothetical protein
MEITLGVVDRSILRADGRDPARFPKSLWGKFFGFALLNSQQRALYFNGNE